MCGRVKKTVAYLLLSTLLLSSTFTPILAKESPAEKVERFAQMKTRLSYTHLGDRIRERGTEKAEKKLTAIRNSVKHAGKYRLLIRSNASFDTINHLFVRYGVSAGIQKF